MGESAHAWTYQLQCSVYMQTHHPKKYMYNIVHLTLNPLFSYVVSGLGASYHSAHHASLEIPFPPIIVTFIRNTQLLLANW